MHFHCHASRSSADSFVGLKLLAFCLRMFGALIQTPQRISANTITPTTRSKPSILTSTDNNSIVNASPATIKSKPAIVPQQFLSAFSPSVKTSAIQTKVNVL